MFSASLLPWLLLLVCGEPWGCVTVGKVLLCKGQCRGQSQMEFETHTWRWLKIKGIPQEREERTQRLVQERVRELAACVGSSGLGLTAGRCSLAERSQTKSRV